MKKNNIALWGTGFVGAFICILIDSNYATAMNSGIGWLGLVGGLVSLVCAYLFFDEGFKVLMSEASKENQRELELQRETEKEAKEERRRKARLDKRLDELLLAQKAVYTMVKKEVEVTEAGYERIENQMIEISDRLLNHQKTMVKALVKYNQENMQSATKSLQKTFGEEILNVQSIGNDLQNVILELAREIKVEMQNQTEEINKNLNCLEDSIKNMNISVAPPIMPQMETPKEEVAIQEIEDSIEEAIIEPVDNMIEDTVIEPIEEIVSLEDILKQEVLEGELAVEPEPVVPPVIEDPNRAMTPDEIAALIASMDGGAEQEEIVEAEPEPVAPPVIEDPNRAMTPDEIAALIASMDSGVKEPEPEPVAPPVIEDPNRAMTPDEIAALIASMG